MADPDQDNESFAVIKLNHNKPMERVIAPKPVDVVDTHSSNVTRVVNLDDVKDDPSGFTAPKSDDAPLKVAAGGK